MAGLDLHNDVWFQNINGKLYNHSGIASVVQQNDSSSSLQPRQGAIQSTILQGRSSSILFDVEGNFSALDQLVLRFLLSNSHATLPALMVDGYSMIQSISVLVNNQTVQTLFGTAERAFRCAAANTEREYAALVGSGISPSTYLSTVSVPALGSLQISVPLHTFLNSEVAHWRKAFKFQIAIQFNDGANLMLSTSTPTIANVTMTDLKIIADGCVLSESAKAKIDSVLNSGPVCHHYNDTQYASVTYGAATAAIAVSGGLVPVGHCSSIYLNPRESTAANETLHYSPSQRLTSFEVLQNGKPVDHSLPDNAMTSELRLILNTKFANSTAMSLLNQHFVSFSEDPVSAYVNGNGGGKVTLMNKNEQIRVVPSTTYTSLMLDSYTNVISKVELDYRTGSVSINRYYID